MHLWFMVCLSTSSFSGDILLAGQGSAATLHSVHGFVEKDWIQPVARLLVAVENPTKKKGDSVCGFIGVRWWRVGNKKGEKLSDVLHLHRASSNELSVDLGVRRRETRAADMLRTNRQTDTTVL